MGSELSKGHCLGELCLKRRTASSQNARVACRQNLLADALCPVSAEALGQLYRADPDRAADMLDGLPEVRRVELALFCYSRAHLRPLAMSIAARCDADRLSKHAGTLGEVLATQCRQQLSTGREKISLAGTRH